MFINTDSNYQIGSTHKYCEDYAIHGFVDSYTDSKIYYSIVSDGCSSSLRKGGIREPINVDVGSRILCIAAKETIRNIAPYIIVRNPQTGLNEVRENFYDIFESALIVKLKDLLFPMGIPFSVVDCTLLVNFCYEGNHIVFFWGDGFYIVETEENTYIYSVDFESGAPFYLSYKLDPIREGLYQNEFGHKRKNFSCLKVPKEGIAILTPFRNVNMYGDPVYLTYCAKQQTISSVLSDGLDSFINTENENINAVDVYQKISKPSPKNKAFLQRGFNILNKWMRKEDIKHTDDFSVASIFFDPGE